MRDPADYRLYRSQAAAMAAIMRYVSRDDYVWHLAATSPHAKILHAVRTLHLKHAILAEPWEQQLRKTSKLPRARLVLAPYPRDGRWPYVLLGTSKLKGERMHRVDNPKHPLTWWAYRQEQGWTPFYQLVLHPVTQAYTWEVVPKIFEEYLAQVVVAAKGDWAWLARTLKSFYVLPQFRGVNDQSKRLFKAASRVWGNRNLRSADGHWKKPPFKRLAPPPTLRGAALRLYITDKEAQEGQPRTLGEALSTTHPV